MPSNTSERYKLLKPTELPNVIDLLEQVGHKVHHWHQTKGGGAVANPAANPAYCFDWAFGSEQEGIVLSVWYASIKPEGDRLVWRHSMRALHDALTAVANSPSRSGEARNRARQQASRALDFDLLMRTASERQLPVRFIINDGNRDEEAAAGDASATVKKRRLDSEPWFVHQYTDSSGEAALVRGVRPTKDAAQEDASSPQDAEQLRAIRTRRGQEEFRGRLITAWGGKCIVTHSRVLGLLEAAHITPHAQEVNYSTANGLLLRSDIHTLYDLCLLSIDAHMRVHLAPKIRHSEYGRYEGFRIERRPDRSADAPSSDALARRHALFEAHAAASI